MAGEAWVPDKDKAPHLAAADCSAYLSKLWSYLIAVGERRPASGWWYYYPEPLRLDTKRFLLGFPSSKSKASAKTVDGLCTLKFDGGTGLVEAHAGGNYNEDPG